MGRIRIRSVAVAALALGLAAAGCSTSEDESGDTPTRVNTVMGATTFHAKGSTTAVAGGTQEIWFDPRQGLHIVITIGGTERAGEMFCHGTDLYTSTDLAVESLRKAGGSAYDVPADLKQSFVRTPAGDGCGTFYEVASSAKEDKKLAAPVGGVPTTAIVAHQGTTTDTYFIATGDKPYVLRLDSNRAGHVSSTTYDSFGAPVSISLPTEDRIVSMTDFRTKATLPR
ncbi:hypothetical protein [Embleya hyalina]|uniref:Lipoprotein n=1 Tax=Embleya hyalina TaxID=516124 RepID=A0A401YZZ7_9ACTN|nr:hypothetical protein [Embleya hyalina]GCE00213.1 hypothetical protein EHYA_07938 [Embleya hyalina]